MDILLDSENTAALEKAAKTFEDLDLFVDENINAMNENELNEFTKLSHQIMNSSKTGQSL